MSKQHTINWYMERYKQAANNAAFFARWADYHRRHKRMQHAISYQEKSARAYSEAHQMANCIQYMDERVSVVECATAFGQPVTLNKPDHITTIIG